jgi:dihydrofolate reductase
MSINIIVAMTKQRIIGKNGKLPWEIKEDMKLFKEKTMGKTVIMGKTTWLSIPKKFRPLPERANIVLSTTLENEKGIDICRNLKDGLKKGNEKKQEIFCIGGARLYEEMLPFTDILHISWIKKNYDGDTYFPKINFEEWEEIETKEFNDFIYKKYFKKN